MFGIYVNRSDPAYCGYLASTGGVTPRRDRAAKWPTAEAAAEEIASRGWENTTSVRPGRVTAYVAEVK